MIRAIVSPDLIDPCLISWKDLITLEYLPEGWPYIKQKARRATTEDDRGNHPEEEHHVENKEKSYLRFLCNICLFHQENNQIVNKIWTTQLTSVELDTD